MDLKRYEIKLPTFPESFGDKHFIYPWGLVKYDAPKRMKKAVEQCARYFQREFRYDFVQYSADKHNDNKIVANIWTNVTHVFSNGKWKPRFAVYGACGFSWTEYADYPASWVLDWVWFHPYERGEGHLTRAWESFEREFPGFLVQTPLSKAMEQFLIKRNEMWRSNPFKYPRGE